MSYILTHFGKIAEKSPDILELSLSQVVEVIGSDELNVKNEEMVWDFVVRWMDRDPEQRRRHIVQLLGLIRLGLMDEGYFLEHVRPTDFHLITSPLALVTHKWAGPAPARSASTSWLLPGADTWRSFLFSTTSQLTA